MKIKTSELIGPAIDWAVAKAEKAIMAEHGFSESDFFKAVRVGSGFHYSTDWSQGGPIIEREGFSVEPFKDRADGWRCLDFRQDNAEGGSTPLIAAMRCYVASKLGDEVDVPDELTKD